MRTGTSRAPSSRVEVPSPHHILPLVPRVLPYTLTSRAAATGWQDTGTFRSVPEPRC